MTLSGYRRRLLTALLVVGLLGVSSGLGGRPQSAGAASLVSGHTPARPWLGTVGQRATLPSGLAAAARHTIGRTLAMPRLAATLSLSSTWTQQAELTSTAQTPNDGYGSPVAISGNTAVVGASNTPFQSAYGAVYAFTRTASGAWQQQAALLDPQFGRGQDHFFGDALALQGNTLVVGAFGATGVTTDTGAAYVYLRTGTTWTLQATITASDGAYVDGFGSAVALWGTTLVVGAPGKNDGEGAAYVFVYSNGAWHQQAEVLYPGHIFNAEFGLAVAVWGNVAVVGAPLAPVAFLYARTGTTWRLQAVLATPHPGYQFFGESVAVWGGTVLVGASSALPYPPGAVYVFGLSGGAWTLQTTLTPPAGVTDSGFGFSVGLNRATAVVGGDGAYVFVGSGTAWTQTQLVPSDRPANMIGIAVAVNGNTALVGAGGAPPAGYVFVRSGADWNVADTTDATGALSHRHPTGTLAPPSPVRRLAAMRFLARQNR